MATTTKKSFRPNSKDVRYINRDFSQLREALINFAKVYYPNTYKDFSPAAPGMMFIEQAAYVGDVLSYYTDYIFGETTIQNATEAQRKIGAATRLRPLLDLNLCVQIKTAWCPCIHGRARAR